MNLFVNYSTVDSSMMEHLKSLKDVDLYLMTRDYSPSFLESFGDFKDMFIALILCNHNPMFIRDWCKTNNIKISDCALIDSIPLNQEYCDDIGLRLYSPEHVLSRQVSSLS